MKDKMIYIMNVDWNWIKQRPHFLAEGLAEIFDVTVMYQHRYGRKGFQKRNTDELSIKPIYVIPRGDRYKFLGKVNQKIKARKIQKKVHEQKARYLFLTFPDQYEAIPHDFTGTVIYDCMDNHPAFVNDVKRRRKIEEKEEQLIKRANVVLVSSEKLKEVLLERYGRQYEQKMYLVRNGYDGDIIEKISVKQRNKNELYTIAYIGTISSWFNFDYITKSIKDIPNINYLLIGPVAGTEIPKSERITYIGTVEHNELQNVTKNVDCLIMPFIVNDIIESVDPVKLYEYINFNKNILCVKYQEIERFEPFVHFYTDYDSFVIQIKNIMEQTYTKYVLNERVCFLKDNTWKRRVDRICSILCVRKEVI